MPRLLTKVYAPQPRHNLVSRLHLLGRLDDGLHSGQRLALISAPAGFGKTALVSEWIAQAGRSAAWLSLDAGDNDPAQFLHYLIAALQQIDQSIGQTAQEMLHSPQPPPATGVIAALVNDLLVADIPLILVIDDYHLISDAAIHEALELLLERQPSFIFMVICTREDPALPLPRLRARNQITEIRERDLRFSIEEANIFFQQTMNLPLKSEAIRALESRTEGWAAGLQLAALALRENPDDVEGFISAFAGSDRYVMDYLVTEVLERLPQTSREFLHQTAILDRLCASLCDAVTGRGDSQAILDQFDRANLFLVHLDHRREWYRYHHLFAEFLRAHLDPAGQKSLHQRAAAWFWAYGDQEEAIRHALAAGDLDSAEIYIRAALESTIHAGGMMTARGWLDALPDSHIRADGELATYRAWVSALTGDLPKAENYAAAAESLLSENTALAKVWLLRALVAIGHQEYEPVIEFASRALDGLSQDQAQWRIIALWLLAEAQERTRPIAEAIDTLREAGQTGRASGRLAFAAVIESTLANALHNHGLRREAVTVCQQVIDSYTNKSGRIPPIMGMMFSRLAALQYDAGQLEEARASASLGIKLGEQVAQGGLLTLVYGMSVAPLYALGETESALANLQKARDYAVHEAIADTTWLLALETNLHLAADDIGFARRWAGQVGISVDDTPDYLRFEEQLTYARLLLAEGELPTARNWLERLETFARERGFYRWLITVHILQALAAEHMGAHPAARDYLTQAVRLAAPEGFTRLFLDEDADVLALLASVRGVAPAFVDDLLASAGVEAESKREATPQPLIEALSERELDVLRLIAVGDSNQEIANKLYISLGTVKRHINHIYGKLEVVSRTQAIVKARAVGLLGKDA